MRPQADPPPAEAVARPKRRLLDNVGIVVPTYNAAPYFAELSASLTLEGVCPSQVLIIDSSSKDATRSLAERSGYRVVCIPKREFNHGGTRRLACSYFPGADKLVFCTQDVVFMGNRAIELLAETLDEPSVGAAYGRQLPRPEANPIERHGRLYNYPQSTQVRTLDSRAELGIKAASLSNSFAIYRRSALESVGGFPPNILVSEDWMVSARMLLAGWKIVYRGDAGVIHSHGLSLVHEASRYFDIGANHARQSWLLEAFGTPSSEGKQFLKSETRYLLSHAPHLLPLAMVRTANKFAAYRLGRWERFLPTGLKQMLSEYPHYWRNETQK